MRSKRRTGSTSPMPSSAETRKPVAGQGRSAWRGLRAGGTGAVRTGLVRSTPCQGCAGPRAHAHRPATPARYEPSRRIIRRRPRPRSSGAGRRATRSRRCQRAVARAVVARHRRPIVAHGRRRAGCQRPARVPAAALGSRRHPAPGGDGLDSGLHVAGGLARAAPPRHGPAPRYVHPRRRDAGPDRRRALPGEQRFVRARRLPRPHEAGRGAGTARPVERARRRFQRFQPPSPAEHQRRSPKRSTPISGRHWTGAHCSFVAEAHQQLEPEGAGSAPQPGRQDVDNRFPLRDWRPIGKLILLRSSTPGRCPRGRGSSDCAAHAARGWSLLPVSTNHPEPSPQPAAPTAAASALAHGAPGSATAHPTGAGPPPSAIVRHL